MHIQHQNPTTMKKLVYTLILCLFALNLSAKIYIVSNETALFNGSVSAKTKEGSGLLVKYPDANMTPIATNGSDYQYAYEVTNIKNNYLSITFANDRNISDSQISDNSIYKVSYNSSGNIVINQIPLESFTITIDANDPYIYRALIISHSYLSLDINNSTFAYTFYKSILKEGITISIPELALMTSNNTFDQALGGNISIDISSEDAIVFLKPDKVYATDDEKEFFPNAEYYYSTETADFTIVKNLNISKNAGDSKSIDDIYKDDNLFGTITYSTTYTKAQVANWLWIACPYDANLSVRTAYGVALKQTYTNDPNENYKQPCFVLKSFDSEKRAAQQTDYWVEQKDASLSAGVGYILGIDPRDINDNIVVTYTSISKTNTKKNQHTDIYAPTNNTSSYANQHLIGTKLFYPATIRNRSNTPCFIATPQENSFNYSIAFNETSKTFNPFSAYYIQFEGEIAIHESSSSSNAPAARIQKSEQDDEQQLPTFENYTIKLTNSKISQETTILMNENGTEGYTLGEDFLYFTQNVDGIPFANQFYSLDQGDPRSFNHRKNENQTISLGGRLQTAGEYTISLNGTDTKAKSVLLTDTYDGSTAELTTENYTFTASDNENIDNRFVITFSFAPQIPTDTYIAEANQIIIYGNANNCNISNLTIGESVMIYDATGRLIYNQTAQSESINICLNAGTYIIRQTNKWAKFAVK